MIRDKEEKREKKKKKETQKTNQSFIFFEFQYSDQQLIDAMETVMNNMDQESNYNKGKRVKPMVCQQIQIFN